MTIEAPDFPETLYDTTPVVQSEADAIVRAIHRLAAAVEQNTLAIIDQRPSPAVTITTPAPVLASLPPVNGHPAPAVQVDGCPIHHAPWKIVPAGVSSKTGKPYDAFRACSTRGCDQRPR